MKPPYTPDAYSTVSPYLIVNGAGATIEFVQRVFGAVGKDRHVDETGRVRHAEMRFGECIVMVSDPVLPDWPAKPADVHVYVADVDAAYRRALEAGAVSVQPPSKKDDADRRCGVRDAGGTTWWIATRVDR